MDCVRGRAISRAVTSGHIAGRKLIAKMALVTPFAPPAKARHFENIIKGWASRDTTFKKYPEGLEVADLIKIRQIISNPHVVPEDELVGTHVFTAMGRVVHRRAGYAVAISLTSNRVSAFESGNGENLTGWWTGVGSTSLYNDDLLQFDENFWPTVNMYRLPGTTTDHSGEGTPISFKPYRSMEDWSGGSCLDQRYASVGMQVSMKGITGSSLSGKKSWFLFDDCIVAMGTGFSTTDDLTVETIVENRRVNFTDQAILIDDKNGLSEQSPSMTTTDASWAYLSGKTTQSGIGYYFPVKTTLEILTEHRTGNWSSLNTSPEYGQNTGTVSDKFVSLAIPHGRSPNNAQYAYVMLPSCSLSEARSYSAEPNIDIIAQNDNIHAVYSHLNRCLGVNIWNGPSDLLYNGKILLTVNCPLTMTVSCVGNLLSLAIADPTQNLNAPIEIILPFVILNVVEAPHYAKVNVEGAKTKILVDPENLKGCSAICRFNLEPDTAWQPNV